MFQVMLHPILLLFAVQFGGLALATPVQPVVARQEAWNTTTTIPIMTVGPTVARRGLDPHARSGFPSTLVSMARREAWNATATGSSTTSLLYEPTDGVAKRQALNTTQVPAGTNATVPVTLAPTVLP